MHTNGLGGTVFAFEEIGYRLNGCHSAPEITFLDVVACLGNDLVSHPVTQSDRFGLSVAS